MATPGLARLPLLRRRGRGAELQPPGAGGVVLSPGLRLFAAPGVLLAAALLCYLLPPRAARLARAVVFVAAAAAGGLLLSDAPLIVPQSRVEHSLGEFAPGVQLVARADSAALAVALLATALALLALFEKQRRPLESSALLLCLAGTYIAAMAGNAVLLFGGIEMANVGALLLAAGGAPRLRLRPRIAFAVQHASSLGLLVAAVALQANLQTSDFAAVPATAMDWWIAGPWALTGVVRLLAPAALPRRPGRPLSSAWLPVGAVPCGLLVLLRLAQVSDSQMPAGVAAWLVGAGLAAALWGALSAARCWRIPAAAGRGLAVSAAGQAIALVGAGSPAAMAGVAAFGLSLMLGLAAAPAWRAGGDQGSGRVAAWVRAAALAAIAGLPVGVGATAAFLGTGAVAAAGMPHSVVAVFAGGIAVLAAAAGALAARAVLVEASVLAEASPSALEPRQSSRAALVETLPAGPGLPQPSLALRVDASASQPRPHQPSRAVLVEATPSTPEPLGRWPALRWDALVVLAVSLIAALLPGLAQTLFFDPVAAAVGGVAGSLDAATAIVPGAGWPGGYLSLAVALALVAAWSADSLQGWRLPAREAPFPSGPPPSLAQASAIPGRVAVPRLAGHSTRALAAVDAWLVDQPGLALVVAGAIASLFIFR